MKISDKGIELIVKFEGLKLKAYKDSVGIWTIGIGTIRYPNGTSVKQNDKITKEQAYDLLRHDLLTRESEVNKLIKSKITQNQYDALISFAYNLGVTSLQRSTLLKKVNTNPQDTTIRDEFMKYVNAGGKPLQGLINRRKQEADIYFS